MQLSFAPALSGDGLLRREAELSLSVSAVTSRLSQDILHRDGAELNTWKSAPLQAEAANNLMRTHSYYWKYRRVLLSDWL